MTIVSTTVGVNPLEELESPSQSTEESKMPFLVAVSQTTEWSQFAFKANHFSNTVIQHYAPTTNIIEAKVERLYEDLHDFLELTPKEDALSS